MAMTWHRVHSIAASPDLLLQLVSVTTSPAHRIYLYLWNMNYSVILKYSPECQNTRHVRDMPLIMMFGSLCGCVVATILYR